MYSIQEVDDRSWVFGYGNAKKSELRRLCEQVEAEFDLPGGRLCRFFADSDDQYLIKRLGSHFRGFHTTLAGARSLPVPEDLLRCFFDSLETSQIVIDDFIYIRRGSWENPTGLVECYAHELQHFVQRAKSPRLWLVNDVLRRKLKDLEPQATAIDIPTERDANIVSKCVTERLCGADAVNAFVKEQIRWMEQIGAEEEKRRWSFFQEVSSSTPFDLLDATLAKVQKHKSVLKFGMDVDADEWWVGPLKDDESDEVVST